MPAEAERKGAVNRLQRRIAAGHVEPNPGGERLRPLPHEQVAGDPNYATMGVPHINTSQISGGVEIHTWPDTGTKLRRLSPPLISRAGTTGFAGESVVPLFGSGTPAVATASATVYDFMFDGLEFELCARYQVSDASKDRRIYVDGQIVNDDGTGYVGLTNGSFYFTKYTFADRRPRHITIAMNGVYFRGIVVGVTDSVWLPHEPAGPVVCFYGDSFAEGARMLIKDDTFGYATGRAMGWKRAWCNGRGGTGYLNTGVLSSGYTTLRGRLAQDLFPHGADIVVVCGGINDTAGAGRTWTSADVYVEAKLLYQAIRDGLPGVMLLAMGPFNPTGSPVETIMTVNDAIQQACLDEDVPYIDPIGGTRPYDGTASHYINTGWITGTGNVQHPIGTGGTTTTRGNADVYTGTPGAVDTGDVTHPSPQGQRYHGLRLAQGIAGVIPL